MKRILFCGIILLFAGNFISAQSALTSVEAMKFYEEARISFDYSQYKKADSLFGLCLAIEPSKERYLARANAREKLDNIKGYCEDLSKAIKLGDMNAPKLFCKRCGGADTSYMTKEGVTTDVRNFYYRDIRYHSIWLDPFTMRLDIFMNNTEVEQNPSKMTFTTNGEVYTIVEMNAEYPGGVAAMMEFIRNNIVVPEAVRKGVSGKVFAKFVVSQDGSINQVTILKGISACPACEEECIRVIKSMPKWKPAMMSGKPVNCYFNLPISFRP